MRGTSCCGATRYVTPYASSGSGLREKVVVVVVVVVRGRGIDGGQIEYLVIAYDEENKNACLSLRQAEILDALAADEKLREADAAAAALSQKGGVEKSAEPAHDSSRDCYL